MNLTAMAHPDHFHASNIICQGDPYAFQASAPPTISRSGDSTVHVSENPNIPELGGPIAEAPQYQHDKKTCLRGIPSRHAGIDLRDLGPIK